QTTAAAILGYLGNRAAAPALLRLAAGVPAGDPPQKPDIDLRVTATLSAGRLGDPKSVPQLVKLLGDKEVALREAAAWGLGLVRALFLRREPVREAALWALAGGAARQNLPPAAGELDTQAGKPDARAYIASLAALCADCGNLPVKLVGTPALRAVQPALKDAL